VPKKRLSRTNELALNRRLGPHWEHFLVSLLRKDERLLRFEMPFTGGDTVIGEFSSPDRIAVIGSSANAGYLAHFFEFKPLDSDADGNKYFGEPTLQEVTEYSHACDQFTLLLEAPAGLSAEMQGQLTRLTQLMAGYSAGLWTVVIPSHGRPTFTCHVAALNRSDSGVGPKPCLQRRELLLWKHCLPTWIVGTGRAGGIGSLSNAYQKASRAPVSRYLSDLSLQQQHGFSYGQICKKSKMQQLISDAPAWWHRAYAGAANASGKSHLLAALKSSLPILP
jgi:hypothetical protein